MSLLVGFAVGIIITIPLGPISIYVAQKTMGGETRKAILVSVGSVIIDILYCLVITLGLMSLVSPYLHNTYVQVGLSCFLILYGLKMLFFDRQSSQHMEGHTLQRQQEKFELGHYNVLLGMTMALANPALFLSWTAVLGFVTAHGLLASTFWDKVVFSFATGLGSFAWFIGLALFVHRKRHTISPVFIRRTASVTALVIIGFGVYFTYIIFRTLNGAATVHPAMKIFTGA